MDSYVITDLFEILTIAIVAGFLISFIPAIVGMAINGILKIFRISERR